MQPPDSGKRLTAYDKRMKTPWSAEALNDEGPAHMVFLDSYLMDKYEVSNKEYGDFIRAKGHPAPAYWDDPRLNKPEQPVVGVNWEDAKAYLRISREAPSDGSGMGKGGPWSPRRISIPGATSFDSAKANYGKNHDATMPVDSYPEGASYYGLYNMAGQCLRVGLGLV